MPSRLRAIRIATLLLLSTAASAQDAAPRWRADPVFQRLRARLEAVRVVDNHTHLLRPAAYDPAIDPYQPVLLRSTWEPYRRAMADIFGVDLKAGLEAAIRRATAVREERVRTLGEAEYWKRHLDSAGVDVVVVNQEYRPAIASDRVRWVPDATDLLYPLPAETLKARSSGHDRDITEIQKHVAVFLKEAGHSTTPETFGGYLAFVKATLGRWKSQGAIGVKFYDSYLRTIAFEDVPLERAASLYEKGRVAPLSRSDYLAVQDHLARAIFLEAGRVGLVVHIHSAHGVPPFLRLHEADVRNLDSVLTDERYFGTRFVLIHGGAPLVEEAAYLALKPHVWIDSSAITFLYPIPDLAAAYRKYLTFAPEKLLFSTDVGNYPGVPVGPEVQHVALLRSSREALTLALAGLVNDGVFDFETAARFGEGALRGNAARLYGFGESKR